MWENGGPHGIPSQAACGPRAAVGQHCPRFKEACTGGCWKVVILPLLARLAWKQLWIDTDMLLIIISTTDKLLNGLNIDDLEWPLMTLNFQNSGCYSNFWLWRTFQEWIAPKWLQIDLHNLHMKFLHRSYIFNHSSFDLLNLKSSIRRLPVWVLLQDTWLFYCTLYTLIAHVAELLLLCITWALLKLLV